jgi:hypothetical protein
MAAIKYRSVVPVPLERCESSASTSSSAFGASLPSVGFYSLLPEWTMLR